MKWITPSPATCIGIWIISSLCGTVIFAAWYLAVYLFRRRGYFYFFYKLLRLMPVFFCFPTIVILYCLQRFPERHQLFFLFNTTQPIRTAAFILALIWSAGALCILGFYLYEIIQMQFLYCRKIPCKCEIMQIYDTVCRKVGGKHFPALYQNYGVKVPVLTGIFQPKIYLPVSNWPKQQLPIIFTHELNHYRLKDIWLKRLASLLLALQWINPAVWIFHKTVILWSEYACDWLSYPMCGGKRNYFQVITSIAEKRGELQNFDVSALFTDIGELEKRVQHVQWCGKKRNGAAWVSTLLTIILLIIGVSVTYEATTIAVKKSYQLYLATENRVELPQAPPPTEYNDDGPSKRVRIQYGKTDDEKNDPCFYSDFKWKLNGYTMYQTNAIDVLSKASLSIRIRTHPSVENVRAGYIDMDGNRSFIDISDGKIDIINIPCEGMYKMFIENVHNSPVKVSGTFTIINEQE